MKNAFYLFLVIGITSIYAQGTFTRTFEIPVPAIENTGLGEMVAGVDFDGDGRMEIYSVNNMLDQGGAEEIPKIYKFEFNPDAGTWDSVWMATITDIPQQNSWGALTTGDWDKDGKPEIIWAPANWVSGANPNPPRILVFEARGDGSEGIGVEVFGNARPNCQWTIANDDNVDVRPIKMELADIDSDNDLELCFVDRSSSNLYRFGVIGLSNVPDDGDGSEIWTMEHSGLGLGVDVSTFYDMAIIDNAMYMIHNSGAVTIVKYEGSAWAAPLTLENLVPGGSWKTANAVDIDGDGSKEIVVAGWASSPNNFFVLQPDAFEVLKSYNVATLTPQISDLGRLNGGAVGDIDNDGKMDIVFGSRGAVPIGAIVRIEYQGGNVGDSTSYTYETIDSLLVASEGQRFDVVKIANLDDDSELEIVYTDGNQINRVPIAIVNFDAAVSVNENIVPNEFYLSQNYPNPFNPSTTIKYSIPLSAEYHSVQPTTLKVFDILGREVTTLVNEQQKAGNYEVNFDASNFTSGIYFYRLQSGSFVATQKMVLLR
ncbi:MAG: T9SS type A sorting domain-containing protein [Bacteroidetes bacterium]|nr:T9SS type A sorting domain-containing protein [Bacteroidota bacterium]MBU1115540.1 T9SS type A sorting domain-containing protein [Bacteroidota bacterium]MBU1797696.1 T9SS type A sorting domain-containing protein [Bacteroidota bacterium]